MPKLSDVGKRLKKVKSVDPRQMDIFSFINAKLLIDDVEPMYSAIVRAKLPLETRQNLCMSEGLADHLGLAARMSERRDYWDGCRDFIKQGLRGGARRHFRGKPALRAVAEMESRFPDLDDFFSSLPDNYYAAEGYICSIPQFGSFSAFKISDMAERTCSVSVDFSKVGIDGLAKFPLRGLELAAAYVKEPDLEAMLDRLLQYDWVMLAPPHRDRPLNIQEIETCLCNYGHSKWHPPGYETQELRKLLNGFGKLASKLQGCLHQ